MSRGHHAHPAGQPPQEPDGFAFAPAARAGSMPPGVQGLDGDPAPARHAPSITCRAMASGARGSTKSVQGLAPQLPSRDGGGGSIAGLRSEVGIAAPRGRGRSDEKWAKLASPAIFACLRPDEEGSSATAGSSASALLFPPGPRRVPGRPPCMAPRDAGAGPARVPARRGEAGFREEEERPAGAETGGGWGHAPSAAVEEASGMRNRTSPTAAMLGGRGPTGGEPQGLAQTFVQKLRS